jgi:hypothetical protein
MRDRATRTRTTAACGGNRRSSRPPQAARSLAVLERAPELLRIARDHLWTTVKRTDLASLAELAARVDPDAVQTVLFVPPGYPEYLSTSDIKQIRRMVRHIFDQEPSGSGSGSGSGGSAKACP